MNALLKKLGHKNRVTTPTCISFSLRAGRKLAAANLQKGTTMKKDIATQRQDQFAARTPSLIPEFDRLINKFFGGSLSPTMSPFMGAGLPQFSRASFAEIRETDQAFVLTAELPGIPKEAIQINVSGNVLTVSAEQNDENDSDEFYRRDYQSYHQSFSLPSNIDAEKIEANNEHGVLEIFLPKTADSNAKKIEVQSGKGGFLNRMSAKIQSGINTVQNNKKEKEPEKKH